LVLFDGAGTRNSVENFVNGTSAILKRAVGNSTGSSYTQVSFNYTVGDPVYDNNGSGSGASTTWLASLLGKDIALRFKGATSTSNIDNVSVSITGPGGPGPVDHFAISSISSPQTVGTPITGITLTAQDASNQTATSFTGTVTFGGTGGFTGTSANFTSGVLTGVSVTPTAAGSNLTLTVDDDSGPSIGSATITTIQTQYQLWAGGADFDADTNGDGVKNGLAFLLGASGPNVPVTLPTFSWSGGNLVMSNFSSRNLASRGTATLSVQHSSDLGIGDPWTTVLVPEATAAEVSGVSYNITPGSPLNTVNSATISGSQSAAGKLFGRLKATQP
jgi:hypothetical protein